VAPTSAPGPSASGKQAAAVASASEQALAPPQTPPTPSLDPLDGRR
jgi:hypothetical protein